MQYLGYTGQPARLLPLGQRIERMAAYLTA
jgi:hypothetical protein